MPGAAKYEPWVGMKEAAAHLGVHYVTFFRLVQSGDGPPYTRWGNYKRARYKFKLSEVDKWARERQQRSA